MNRDILHSVFIFPQISHMTKWWREIKWIERQKKKKQEKDWGSLAKLDGENRIIDRICVNFHFYRSIPCS